MARFQDTRIGKGVMHFCSNSLCMYDAALAHDCQMLADLCLPLACYFNQLFYRSWLFTQQVEEFQACRVGESLAEICLQAIELFFSFLVHFWLLICRYSLILYHTRG